MNRQANKAENDKALKKTLKKALRGKPLNGLEALVLMNCWEYCPACGGWGVEFIEAGIPNRVATCIECLGKGLVWK